MDVVIECLILREGRQGIDVVQDEVENQLYKVSLINIILKFKMYCKIFFLKLNIYVKIKIDK